MFNVDTACTKRLVAIDTKTKKEVGEARRVKIHAGPIQTKGWLLTRKGRLPTFAENWDNAANLIRSGGDAVRIENLETA